MRFRRIGSVLGLTTTVVASSLLAAAPALAHERYETPGCGSSYGWHSSGGHITGSNPDISRVDMYYDPIKNVFCGINRRIGPADGSPGLTTVRLRDNERVSSAGGVRSHYAGPTYIYAGDDRCVDVGSVTVYGSVVELMPTGNRRVCGRPPLM